MKDLSGWGIFFSVIAGFDIFLGIRFNDGNTAASFGFAVTCALIAIGHFISDKKQKGE